MHKVSCDGSLSTSFSDSVKKIRDLESQPQHKWTAIGLLTKSYRGKYVVKNARGGDQLFVEFTE
jgi:hypothetical protein